MAVFVHMMVQCLTLMICSAPPREGAYVNGLFMEGARWDMLLGTIADSRMKELFPAMPVIFIKAVTQDKQDVKNVYECPVYKIRYGCTVGGS